MDVVPTPDLDRWIEDPFKGVIKDGYIWGRGTIDDKHMMMAWMETLELLLKEGFKPKRTIYISFGHDEEISGFQGAFEIRKYFLQTLGSNCFEFMLDEGLFIIDGVVPGLKKPVAMVCVAEKGYATFKLSVSVEPGHSSAPPKETAIGILAKAVNKLEDNPHRLHFNGVAKKFFNQLIPDMNIYFKFILTNLWFF
jgi:carboxypeptidase PM20D1